MSSCWLLQHLALHALSNSKHCKMDLNNKMQCVCVCVWPIGGKENNEVREREIASIIFMNLNSLQALVVKWMPAKYQEMSLSAQELEAVAPQRAKASSFSLSSWEYKDEHCHKHIDIVGSHSAEEVSVSHHHHHHHLPFVAADDGGFWSSGWWSD